MTVHKDSSQHHASPDKAAFRGGIPITEDGSRYFGMMMLRSPYGNYGDLVGLRNSHDNSFPIGIAFGSRVPVGTAVRMNVLEDSGVSTGTTSSR